MGTQVTTSQLSCPPIMDTSDAGGGRGYQWPTRDTHPLTQQHVRQPREDLSTNTGDIKSGSGPRVALQVKMSRQTEVSSGLFLLERIGNQQVLFLLDTGCSQNRLAKNVFNRLPGHLRSRLQPTNRSAVITGGT